MGCVVSVARNVVMDNAVIRQNSFGSFVAAAIVYVSL